MSPVCRELRGYKVGAIKPSWQCKAPDFIQGLSLVGVVDGVLFQFKAFRSHRSGVESPGDWLKIHRTVTSETTNAAFCSQSFSSAVFQILSKVPWAWDLVLFFLWHESKDCPAIIWLQELALGLRSWVNYAVLVHPASLMERAKLRVKTWKGKPLLTLACLP